jgi:hypothetical protein
VRATLSLGFFLLLASRALAATPIAGGSLASQTWTPAGSPYIVTGDVNVGAGVTLTLLPGTVVQAAGGDTQASGIDSSRVELIVDGVLSAVGTSGAPVSFQAQSSVAGAWYGIEVNAGGKVTFDFATVQHAVNGVTSNATSTDLAATNSSFLQCTNAGMLLNAGSPTLANLLFRNDDTNVVNYGLWVSGTAAPSLSGATFAHNYHGLYNASAATTSVSGSTFFANRYGVRSSGASAVTNVKSSILSNQISYGLYNESGTVNIRYSNLWQNGGVSPGNLGSIGGGTGNQSANPLYVNPSGNNLALTSSSPSRFASDVGTDIGAAPYAGVATSGLHGTLWNDVHLTSSATADGDLTVAPGVALTIDPGVTLRFAAGDVMVANADSTRSELIVNGTLNATGTAALPITFAGVNQTAAAWYGVTLSGATSSTLSRVVIESALNCLTMTGGAHTVNHATIGPCLNAAMRLTGGAPTLDALTIDNGNATTANYGILVIGVAAPTITNAIITNTFFGVYNAAAGTTTINGATFYGNQYGVRSLNASAVTNLTNAILTDQIGYGLLNSSGTINISYSDQWMNGGVTPGNFGSIGGGTGNLGANPQYVNPAGGNFQLMGTSPCIDAGDRAGVPSHDRADVVRPLDGDGMGGAQVDLGAFEYVMSICGNYTLDAGETCDDGANNGSYDFCNALCTGPGAHCGDGAKNGPERCDDGANNGSYGFCNALCTALGPRCGDSNLNGPEVCDEGVLNGTYGRCNASCTGLGTRCGDGIPNGPEFCDDGANNGTYGHCTSDCSGAGPACGDGTENGPEACDEGGGVNGSYGHCKADCSGPGAHCGDGVQNGPETCDVGLANGTYGAACNLTCTGPGPSCGDGTKNGPEVCDEGSDVNGSDGHCASDCSGLSALSGGADLSTGLTGAGGCSGCDVAGRAPIGPPWLLALVLLALLARRRRV